MATKKQEKAQQPAGARNVGRVVQVIGPVLDVEFEPERLPELYNAVVIDHAGNGAPAIRLTAEVQHHIGRNQVRAVALSWPDGLVLGLAAVHPGQPISVLVREAAVGGMLHVLWEPLDGGEAVPT